ARLIASALKVTGGKLDDKDAFRKALRAADFKSVRGAFKFGPNNHPIQDIYVRQVVQEGDTLTNKTLALALSSHGDAYAADCKF
ncbi:MAG: ABC transporter substrate-binding protein, partial [Kiloniellales bacterium]|nr:ABC transporter substrate-binding protein [Kiloniellales bacterium]